MDELNMITSDTWNAVIGVRVSRGSVVDVSGEKTEARLMPIQYSRRCGYGCGWWVVSCSEMWLQVREYESMWAPSTTSHHRPWQL